MKILSADKARERTNKYCLLDKKRKKKELRKKTNCTATK